MLSLEVKFYDVYFFAHALLIFSACDICCFEDKLTFLGTKYDNSVIDHPALIDVHCIISIKCAKDLP